MRMQLYLNSTGALTVVSLTARHQVRGNTPDTFGLPSHDTGAAQRFQAPHMGIDDLVDRVTQIGLGAKARAILCSPIDAVLANGRNVVVGGARCRPYFNDATRRKLAQVRGTDRNVMSASVDVVDDDIGPLIELVEVAGRQDPAD